MTMLGEGISSQSNLVEVSARRLDTARKRDLAQHLVGYQQQVGDLRRQDKESRALRIARARIEEVYGQIRSKA